MDGWMLTDWWMFIWRYVWSVIWRVDLWHGENAGDHIRSVQRRRR